MIARRGLVIAGALVVGAVAAADAARPLIADLSSKRIEISTGFTGAHLLLFGSTDGAGDVAVVVRGPLRSETVRRKERVGGIWVNGRSLLFEDVPAYYFVASTRPLKAITDEATLREHRIGIDRLRLPVAQRATPAEAKHFRAALIRLKRRDSLYVAAPGGVALRDGRLFRVDITFPATVPIGTYSAEVYLFRDGRTVGTALTPITVRKVGLEAAVFEFAHRHSAFYGILAILIALLAGWLAGVIFRRS